MGGRTEEKGPAEQGGNLSAHGRKTDKPGGGADKAYGSACTCDSKADGACRRQRIKKMAGGCDWKRSGGSYCDHSIHYHVKPQSPDSTKPKEKGPLFNLICVTDSEKYELSEKKGWLRQINKKQNREYVYQRVTDEREKKAIEDRSVNWKCQTGSKYFIMVQCDAKEESTGHIKIIERRYAKVSLWGKITAINEKDWLYYTRRNKR